MAAFCESGVSVSVAARRADGRAIAGVALGARARPEASVRVLLRGPANRELAAAVRAGSPVAVTFSRPSDHRSVQLKAARATVIEPAAEDLAALAGQTAVFREALLAIGYSPAFAALYGAYSPGEVIAVRFVPERAFVQTPGPGAGGEIKP